MSATTFFCGIGGSGMSALAQILASRGDSVQGSDRSRDRGENDSLYKVLESQGIRLFPQDGSGIGPHIGRVVVSTAVEDRIPDVAAAMAQGIPVLHRSDLLASLFNPPNGSRSRIAVGGSSGKSTVTGMIATILQSTGRRPTVINGAIMLNAGSKAALGNAVSGDLDDVLIEADESDGSISKYEPGISVVTNISLDHKSIDELTALFQTFCRKSDSSVINLDSEHAAGLVTSASAPLTFSTERRPADLRADAIELTHSGSCFRAVTASGAAEVSLQVPGAHNVSNALAAIGAATRSGVPLDAAASVLSGFQGIKRRLQVLGGAGGVTLIDDFAHNPDKIAASLATLRRVPGRLLVVFQPHGFAPTRLTKDGLIDAFSRGLGEDDLLLMPEIYYAGGTARKDISSRDLTDAVALAGRRADFIPDRSAIAARLLDEANPGDRIVIMGARDDTLTDFGRHLLDILGSTTA